MKVCPVCFQEVLQHQSFAHWLFQDALLCGDCLQKWEHVHYDLSLQGCSTHVLYVYNDFLENLLFQYKEGQDVALREIFFHEYRRWIEHTYRGYTLVLMPSSREKTQERGYHALLEMVKQIDLPYLQPFYKTENRKQSTLSFAQRQTIQTIMRLDPAIKLPQKALLIDDVCTTGATLQCAYQLLPKHTMEVRALVLCATPRFLQQHPPSATMREWIKRRVR